MKTTFILFLLLLATTFTLKLKDLNGHKSTQTQSINFQQDNQLTLSKDTPSVTYTMKFPDISKNIILVGQNLQSLDTLKISINKKQVTPQAITENRPDQQIAAIINNTKQEDVDYFLDGETDGEYDGEIEITISQKDLENPEEIPFSFLGTFYQEVENDQAIWGKIDLDFRGKTYLTENQVFQLKESLFSYKVTVNQYQRFIYEAYQAKPNDQIQLGIAVTMDETFKKPTEFATTSITNLDLQQCDKPQCTVRITVQIKYTGEPSDKQNSFYLGIADYDQIPVVKDQTDIEHTNPIRNQVQQVYLLDAASAEELILNVSETGNHPKSDYDRGTYQVFHYQGFEGKYSLFNDIKFIYAGVPFKVLYPNTKKYMVFYHAAALQKSYSYSINTQNTAKATFVAENKKTEYTLYDIIPYTFFAYQIQNENNKGLKVEFFAQKQQENIDYFNDGKLVGEESDDDEDFIIDKFHCQFIILIKKGECKDYMFPITSDPVFDVKDFKKIDDNTREFKTNKPIIPKSFITGKVFVDPKSIENNQKFTIKITEITEEPTPAFTEIALNEVQSLTIKKEEKLTLETIVDPTKSLQIMGQNLQNLVVQVYLNNKKYHLKTNKLDKKQQASQLLLQLTDGELTHMCPITTANENVDCKMQIFAQPVNKLDTADFTDFSLLLLSKASHSNTIGPIDLKSVKKMENGFSFAHFDENTVFQLKYSVQPQLRTYLASYQQIDQENMTFSIAVSQVAKDSKDYPAASENATARYATNLENNLCKPLEGDNECYYHVTLKITEKTTINYNKNEEKTKNSLLFKVFTIKDIISLHNYPKGSEISTNLAKNDVISIFANFKEDEQKPHNFDFFINDENPGKYLVFALGKDLTTQAVQPLRTYENKQQFAIEYQSSHYLILYFPTTEKQTTYTPVIRNDMAKTLSKASETVSFWKNQQNEYGIFTQTSESKKVHLVMINPAQGLKPLDNFKLQFKIYKKDEVPKIFPDFDTEKLYTKADFQGGDSKSTFVLPVDVEKDSQVFFRFVYENTLEEGKDVKLNLQVTDKEEQYEPIHLGNVYDYQYKPGQTEQLLKADINPKKGFILTGQNFQLLSVQISINEQNIEVKTLGNRSDSQIIAALSEKDVTKICNNEGHCEATITIIPTPELTTNINASLSINSYTEGNGNISHTFEPYILSQDKFHNLAYQSVEQTTIHYKAKALVGDKLVLTSVLYDFNSQHKLKFFVDQQQKATDEPKYPQPILKATQSKQNDQFITSQECKQEKAFDKLEDEEGIEQDACVYLITLLIKQEKQGQQKGSVYLSAYGTGELANLKRQVSDPIDFSSSPAHNNVAQAYQFGQKDLIAFLLSFKDASQKLTYKVYYQDRFFYKALDELQSGEQLAITKPYENYLIFVNTDASQEVEYTFTTTYDPNFVELNEDEYLPLDLEYVHHSIKGDKTNQILINMQQESENNDLFDRLTLRIATYETPETKNQVYPTKQSFSFTSQDFEIRANEGGFTLDLHTASEHKFCITKNCQILMKFSIKDQQDSDKLSLKLTEQFESDGEENIDLQAGVFQEVLLRSANQKLIYSFNIDLQEDEQQYFKNQQNSGSDNEKSYYINFQNPTLYKNFHYKITVHKHEKHSQILADGNTLKLSLRKSFNLFTLHNKDLKNVCQLKKLCKFEIEITLQDTKKDLPQKPGAYIQYTSQHRNEINEDLNKPLPIFDHLQLTSANNYLKAISQNVLKTEQGSTYQKYTYIAKKDDLNLQKHTLIYAISHYSMSMNVYLEINTSENEPTPDEFPVVENLPEAITGKQSYTFLTEDDFNYLAITVYVKITDPKTVEQLAFLIGYENPTADLKLKDDIRVNQIVHCYHQSIDFEFESPLSFRIRNFKEKTAPYTYSIYQQYNDNDKPVLLRKYNIKSEISTQFDTLKAKDQKYYVLIIPDQANDGIEYTVIPYTNPFNFVNLFKGQQQQMILPYGQNVNEFLFFHQYPKENKKYTQFSLRFNHNPQLNTKAVKASHTYISSDVQFIAKIDTETKYEDLEDSTEGIKVIHFKIDENNQTCKDKECTLIVRFTYDKSQHNNNNDVEETPVLACQIQYHESEVQGLDIGSIKQIPMSLFFPSFSVKSAIDMSKLTEDFVLTSQQQISGTINYEIQIGKHKQEAKLTTPEDFQSQQLMTLQKKQIESYCKDQLTQDNKCPISVVVSAENQYTIDSSNSAVNLQVITYQKEDDRLTFDHIQIPDHPANIYFVLQTTYSVFHIKTTSLKQEIRIITFADNNKNPKKLNYHAELSENDEFVQKTDTELDKIFSEKENPRSDIIKTKQCANDECVYHITLFVQKQKNKTFVRKLSVADPTNDNQPATFFVNNAILNTKNSNIQTLNLSEQPKQVLTLATKPSENNFVKTLKVRAKDTGVKSDLHLSFSESAIGSQEKEGEEGTFVIYYPFQGDYIPLTHVNKSKLQDFVLHNNYKDYIIQYTSDPNQTRLFNLQANNLPMSQFVAKEDKTVKFAKNQATQYFNIIISEESVESISFKLDTSKIQNYEKGDLKVLVKSQSIASDNVLYPETAIADKQDSTKVFEISNDEENTVELGEQHDVKHNLVLLTLVYKEDKLSEDNLPVVFSFEEFSEDGPNPGPKNPDDGPNTGLIIAIVFGCLIVISVIVWFIIRHRRKQRQNHLDYQDIEYDNDEDENQQEFQRFSATDREKKKKESEN